MHLVLARAASEERGATQIDVVVIALVLAVVMGAVLSIRRRR